MPQRVLIIVAVIAAATAFGLWWRTRQGRVRTVEVAGALSSATLGARRGEHATFVQFSTPMCTKCPPTARLLGSLAAATPGVTHIEIDAAERLDLARDFHIMRTPTILVLDGDGRIVSRMDGAPTAQQARAALDTVPPTGTDYSI